ncbi:hypothetical protein CSB45_13900 [candidate division KSB3 bacterium]|uniref:Uncharacterized protein n=1 Tax=candidate division KSB3 bacterium TaxID=2044937 RepID=A0A2G6E2F1_9BACT|nr:MAG: hypothetical protein CSB45_13900 [candidate division KSB3 bacterium]PIE28499.1 MAG: hypothetical protein CSA57_13415 [candidate division KSB3 bacterium]
MISVQRLMMYLTPIWLLNIMCRVWPKMVIGLLCHWLNEKNPNLEYRRLAKRQGNFLPVAKKFSKLSDLSIIYLLKQDESLWKLYIPGLGKMISLGALRYIFLEIIFELGGKEGRDKVKSIIGTCRATLGGKILDGMFSHFKIETVLDLFEALPPAEVRSLLSSGQENVVALWLTHWDLRMNELGRAPKSPYWITQFSGERAYKIEELMRGLDFRTSFRGAIEDL